MFFSTILFFLYLIKITLVYWKCLIIHKLKFPFIFNNNQQQFYIYGNKKIFQNYIKQPKLPNNITYQKKRFSTFIK